MSQFTTSQSSMLALAFAAASIALLVSYSVDAEPLGEGTSSSLQTVATLAPQVAPFEMPTLAPSAIVLNSKPAVRAQDNVVTFFFAPSKTHLALNADQALKDVAQAIQQGQRVQISGFHDETGNPRQNVILAKQRAEVVKKRLITLGAPAQMIEMKKPAMAVTTSDHAEARRVEVTLLPQ